MGPPKNLEKIPSSTYGRYESRTYRLARACHMTGLFIFVGSSLIFLDPVPTIFIFLSVLFSLNDFFVPPAEEAHLP